MHFLFRKVINLFVIVVVLVGTAQHVQAQSNPFGISDLSNVEIENYSNEQIFDIYSRAAASGYTREQLFDLAAQKGMPSTELKDFRNRLSAILEQKNIGNTSGSTLQHPTGRFDSSYQYVPLRRENIDETIFGSELFASSSLVFEPNLRIPAPANYMLGPGDELVILVFGYSEKKYEIEVNELGEIYIPNVGPVLVSGLTLENATQKIKNRLANTIYSAIRSGKTKVEVTLGKIRSIRVTVIGQAKKPGTYTVSSLTTLYNLLYLCGGPNDKGSYRKIEVIRGDTQLVADLYEFLVYGNQQDNLLLQEGDVVRIPYYEIRVHLNGNVKREGKFEMKPGETFTDLLNFSGGFTDNAYRGAVTITRLTDSTRKIIDLSSSGYADFYIKGSDQIMVREIQDEFDNRIYISGSVQRPGIYQLTNGLTMGQLIHKAGGLTVDAYTQRALVYRYMTNKMPAIESVNLDTLINSGSPFYLQKNDSVVIHSVFYFHDNSQVSIMGSVRNPRNIQWRKNLTLKDILFAVGGINERGDSSNIEISRRIKDASISELNHQESKVLQVNLYAEEGNEILIEPHDIIIIKEKPGYTEQRMVYVKGEVKSPGSYTLKQSKSTIRDVILRTGGFKASADSSAIAIRRINESNFSQAQKARILQRILSFSEDSLNENPDLKKELYRDYDLISVDLKRAIHFPNSSANLVLEDGDILIVDRSANLVRVSGEVYFPTIVPYKPGENLKYYVEQAGDFMPQARKTGALVIQPDGQVETVKNFLWFKIYPDITPRSEIFVPRKSEKNRDKMTIAEWSVIVSSLALVSNVIINISK